MGCSFNTFELMCDIERHRYTKHTPSLIKKISLSHTHIDTHTLHRAVNGCDRLNN